ncbi:protein of unknown function [Cupriavidus taiwanensis]|uniref:Uncharacterized protein n=1 Tax=Cupriavidus taiwanensis TaxID=164546 RepID=A0A7Z7J5H9_9BURK|nr:hypothetical protein CBM2595_A30082 [Cupriavidus taiwanensis]SPC08763.1 hypothetical protein CBM2594_A40086 [Cupriavidus taiwanensis]SPD38508.1 protein of unknown function [Cupriavidus taiwanensis]
MRDGSGIVAVSLGFTWLSEQ